MAVQGLSVSIALAGICSAHLASRQILNPSTDTRFAQDARWSDCMKRYIVLWLVAASYGSSQLPGAEPAPLVAAPAGTLRGAAVGDIRVFKGIPYALPPTGPLRWKPPVPAPGWKNTREATEFGSVCVQPKPQPGSIYSWNPRPMSEDCLSLNIWAPAGARNAPVFFWIHGGAL